MTKRNHIGKGLFILSGVVLSLLLIVGCNKQDPEGTKTLKIQLARGSASLRFADLAKEGQDLEAYYHIVTLKFWNADGSRQLSPYGVSFLGGSEGMDLLTGEGYELKVPQSVMKVSVECNILNDQLIQPVGSYTDILNYQEESVFVHQPYFSEKVSLGDPDGSGVYIVNLQPKPVIARLEIGGKLEFSKPYENVSVTGIYLNNYIKDSSKPGERLCLTPDDYDMTTGEWRGHPEQMRDFDWVSTSFLGYDETTHPTYHFFPANAKSRVEDDAPHVIVRLSYERQGVKFENRFITIRRFVTSDDKEFIFEIGHVYRLDLSCLSDLFKPNDDGTVDDPTDDRPEENSTIIDGTIIVDPWEPVDIPVEL